jgi:hypothetical protein
MNPEAFEVLKTILIKTVEELTDADKGFLKARIAYLTSEQRTKYASVLGEPVPVVPTPEAVPEIIATPAPEVQPIPTVSEQAQEIINNATAVVDQFNDNGTADPDFKG